MHIAPTELNWSTVAKNAEVGHARSSATCSIVDLPRIDWLRTLQRTRTQQANSSSYDVNTPIGIHVFRVIFQSSSFQFMWCEWGSMEAPTTTSVDDRTRFVVVCSIAEQRVDPVRALVLCVSCEDAVTALGNDRPLCCTRSIWCCAGITWRCKIAEIMHVFHCIFAGLP